MNKKFSDLKKYWTIEQIRLHLGCSKQYIGQLRIKGRIEFDWNGQWFALAADVKKFKEQMKNKGGRK